MIAKRSLCVLLPVRNQENDWTLFCSWGREGWSCLVPGRSIAVGIAGLPEEMVGDVRAGPLIAAKVEMVNKL